MTTAAATLNGKHVTDARLTIPAWGVSYHDVAVDGEVTLSGKVTLVVADLTISCTVLSGGAAAGRSYFRLVAGGGGWGKTLPKKSYANDAGVKLATVLGDAAAAAGETFDLSTVDASVRLGPAFARPEGPACRILEIVAPNAWYVGEDGKTRLGRRAPSTLSAKTPRTSQIDLARGTVTLASETLANVLPGLVVDGLEAVDVEHEVSSAGGLRSKIWGRRGTGNSRRLAAWRAIAEQMDPDRQFRSVYEYRVVTQEGERLNLQPIRVSTGMPDLRRVFVRPGLPGCKATHLPGARVLVGFVDADAARPVVLGFEDAEGSGFLPVALDLYAPGQPAARLGDQVTSFLPPTLPIVGSVTISGSPSPFTGTITVMNPITGTITGGSGKVTIG